MKNRWRHYQQNLPKIDKQWQMTVMHSPSPLMGYNGIFIGIDGALYIAQAMGGQISLIDIDTAELSVAVPQGTGMTGCDDGKNGFYLGCNGDGSLVVLSPLKL